MPRKSNKKQKLLQAAVQLFQQQGCSNTTLSDIAVASGVPLGNVYYYFKTKQDLVLAVIDLKDAEYMGLYAEWEKEDPKTSLFNFIKRYESDAVSIESYGCPVGGLSLELNKSPSELSKRADGLLLKQLKWVTEQFKELGREEGAQKLAMHMMTSLQGSCLLANALHNKDILLDEAKRLHGFVDKM